MRKQAFNLIEIALAIAIIAVGLSSVLVLFPIGLNSSNSATADNLLPDIADYLLGYMEARTQAEWREKDSSGNWQAKASNAFLDSLAAEKPADSFDDKTTDSSTWDDSTKISGNDNLRQKKIDSNMVFLYTQSYEVNGTSVTDFSAAVHVWKENVPLALRNAKTYQGAFKNHVAETDTDNQLYAIALCAEISYPADKPYDQREKYLFRRVIYNQVK